MKAYLSVFMLMVRSSIYKVLGLFALLSAAEYILFRKVLEPEIAVYQSGLDMVALEDLFEFSHMGWALGIAFLLLTVILCYIGCSYGSRQEYTLRRLSITERQVLLCQAVYNMICYSLLLMIQIILAYWFCKMYTDVWEGVANSNQIIFLAFYRSEFLHSIMPLEDVGLWIRNLIFLLGLGLTSAFYPYRQRQGKTQVEIFSMCLIVVLWFFRELGGQVSDFFSIGMTVILIGVVAYRLFDRGVSQEDSL